MTEFNTASSQGGGDKIIPAAARWLGGTGVIPFVACALVAVLGPPDWSGWALKALLFYGAVILSFLGGIQWGLAMSAGGASKVSTIRLSISVVPSLVGWAALLMPSVAGLLVMTAAFAAVLLVDLRAATHKEVPAWYPKLRVPLSAAVMASLAVAAAGSA